MKNLLAHGRSRMNGTRFKLIGIILMVCDHIHQMFINFTMPARFNITWLSMLWRPVLPMFLFALSEGMQHTRNRKKYLLLLFGASIVMFIAMYLLQEWVHVEGVELMNNVFRTLFITGLYMVFYDMLRKGIQAKSVKKILSTIGLILIPIIVSIAILMVIMKFSDILPQWAFIWFMIVPNLFMVEGGLTAVILGILFYIFRKWRRAQVAALAAFSLLSFLTHNPESGANIQRIMIFAAIPMLLYNGQKGKGRKYFFYVFYPLHIAILYVMAYFLS